jgi:hypothetical protein
MRMAVAALVRSSGALTAGLVLAVTTCVLAQGTGAGRGESPENYPEGAHREETFYTCTACHGFKIVAAQGMSRERWDETVTWMTERHKMPKLEGAERDKVLDYLASTFPERPRAPGGWTNPFAPK